MKKKTIKFYFFNKTVKQPAVAYLFCFSKKFMKTQRRFLNLVYIAKNAQTKKQKRRFKEIIKYKNTLKFKFFFNQWLFSKNKLHFFLKNAFFLEKKFYKTSIFVKWFLFKMRFHKKMLKKITNFSRTGIISSHYVHFFLRKNITYQSRSKYRASVFNANFIAYHNNITMFNILKYVRILNNLLYFYTSNINKQNSWIDDKMELNMSNWTNIFTIKSYNRYIYCFNTNDENFDWTSYRFFNQNHNEIINYFQESDLNLKLEKQTALFAKIDHNLLENIFFYKMFYFLKPTIRSHEIQIIHNINYYNIMYFTLQ